MPTYTIIPASGNNSPLLVNLSTLPSSSKPQPPLTQFQYKSYLVLLTTIKKEKTKARKALKSNSTLLSFTKVLLSNKYYTYTSYRSIRVYNSYTSNNKGSCVKVYILTCQLADRYLC